MSDTKDALHERVPGLFEPDTLLPTQYFDRLRQRGGHSGEWLLMLAILEDAVNVYLKQAAATGDLNSKLFEEAEQWIEEDGTDWIFSFESICDMLGLDAEYVRRGLRTAKMRARRARASSAVAAPVTIEVGHDDDSGLRRASGE
jgi:hypothetical protein